MDYRFMLVPDIEIVIIVSGWIIAAYCVCKACDGIGKKIAMLLATPLVTLWVPAIILTNAVQDVTMYDYYRASITYNLENAFKADYYSHLDTNGKPDFYAEAINQGMSKIDDNVAAVGRKFGYGIPDRPGFEELNEHIQKQHFALFIDSMYGLYEVPLWSLVLCFLTIYGLAWYANKTAKLYPIEDQTADYKVLQDQIATAKAELNDLDNKIGLLNKRISQKESQNTAMDKKIAEKSNKIKNLENEIRKKMAESDAFEDD